MSALPGSPTGPQTHHATTVAHAGRAVFIQGASGCGKSGLALQLIALGAGLVADDRTLLRHSEGTLVAEAPDPIRGQIEARGMGILSAPAVGPTPLALVVDLDSLETNRLPPMRTTKIMGVTLPLQRKVAAPHFPAAIMVYLEQGRIA